ncbi:MAG: hypothetical protein HY537_09170 [Deltaproteobacteria bacterium]|nr:hypothetical protein [Deltaproteobacteria bacterium]
MPGDTGETFCTDGTQGNQCLVPTNYNGIISAAQYDATYGWLLLNTKEKRILKMKAPGNSNFMGTLVVPDRTPTSFAFRRNSDGSEEVFFCSSGKLYRRGLNDTSDTELPWPVPSVACTGRSLLLHDNKLIFPYTENSLTGIAQYLLE